MVTRVREPSRLEAMSEDRDVRTHDFFKEYGADHCDEKRDICVRMADRFVNEHGTTRLGSLFGLNANVAHDVIRESGAPVGWFETIQDIAGFKWQVHQVPASTSLCEAGSEGKVVYRRSRPAKRRHPGTVSDNLSELGTLRDQFIPQEVFEAAIYSTNPALCAIDENEVIAMTDNIVAWALATYGRVNLGMPLCRHFGIQLQRMLPHLPQYGKTAGVNRKWSQMIFNKCNNRFYVRPLTPPRCVQGGWEGLWDKCHAVHATRIPRPLLRARDARHKCRLLPARWR